VDDQESSTARVKLGGCGGRGWESAGCAVADVDPEPVAVVLHEQVNWSKAMNYGVGHQFAGEEQDGVEQVRRPVGCERPEMVSGESGGRQGVGKYLRLRPVHSSS
ncbi:MAG TPA: hypothetical protein VI357_10870, partial [Mycobacteriales bacterium]